MNTTNYEFETMEESYAFKIIIESNDFMQAWEEYGDKNVDKLERVYSSIRMAIEHNCFEDLKHHLYYFVKYTIKYGNAIFEKDGSDENFIANMLDVIVCHRMLECEEKYKIPAEIGFKKLLLICGGIMGYGKTDNISRESLSTNWTEEYKVLRDSIITLQFPRDTLTFNFIESLKAIGTSLEVMSNEELFENCIKCNGTVRRIIRDAGVQAIQQSNPIFGQIRDVLLKRVSFIFNKYDRNNDFLEEWLYYDSGVWKFKNVGYINYLASVFGFIADLGIKRVVKKIGEMRLGKKVI